MSTDSTRRDQILSVRASLGRALVAGHRLRGCTEQEVADLRPVAAGRRPLPAGYEEFLLIAGRHAGQIAAGSWLTWPAPLVLTEGAFAMAGNLGVAERLEHLPAFVAFLDHQGHSMLLLVWDGSSERVVLLDEREPHLHLAVEGPTFGEWLEREVQTAIGRQPVPGEVPPPFE